MLFPVATFVALPLISGAFAGKVRFNGHRHKTAKTLSNLAVSNAALSPGSIDLDSVKDLLYIANITIDGKDYPVQLDTGSSDLWIAATPPFTADVSFTALTTNLTYGIGWAAGTIATAPVSFAGFDIPKQAYLNVTAAQNPVFDYDAVGILGLGFTSLSHIDRQVSAIGSDFGRSFLYNTFLKYPNEPNYIAFRLTRSSDPNVHTEGSFTIGEVDPAHAAVLGSTAVPTFPIENPTRWSVLLDGYSIAGGAKKSLKSVVVGAPEGHAIAILDSGTSFVIAPAAFVEEVYGAVKGAKLNKAQGLWTVPCDAEVHVSFFFSGQEFPLHPLDVVVDDATNTNSCIGSFIPNFLSVAVGEFDILAGDSFLRSVYSVYDFGDFVSPNSKVMGNPYVKLLSLTNLTEASAEFHSVRGGSGVAAAANAGSGSGSTPTLNDIYNDLEKVLKYLPAALAIIAICGLTVCVIGCVAVAYFLRSRKPRGGVVGTRPNLGPSPPGNALLLNNRTGGNTDSTAFLTGPGSTRGSYAPVSMYSVDTGTHNYEQPKYNV